MNYFVVEEDGACIAVVFHDYRTSYYVIKSKSDAFRSAFDNAAKILTGFRLSRADDSCVKVFAFDVGDPLWSKMVVEKACGGFWDVVETGVFGVKDSIESVELKYLV